jgi:CYTH domain-containing protein
VSKELLLKVRWYRPLGILTFKRGFYAKKGVMVKKLEREYRFLINRLPADIDKFPSKIIEDTYIPVSAKHPVTRIRRNGDKLVITKKYPADSNDYLSGDSSRMIEQTIELNPEEYSVLKQIPGKSFKKRRFAYQIDGCRADLDIYLDKLAGLVVIDFEFDTEGAMKSFKKPTFAGADVTQDSLTAGGMLCGKSYNDISKELKIKYGYEPVQEVEKYGE